MIGNSDSIDFSLSSLYKSWFAFRGGKRDSSDILSFQYALEPKLSQLSSDLQNRTYKHGGYAFFEVHDSKPRDIAVAAVRDRVVHRLVYDFVEPQWDKSFIFDAWSCRKGKGQHLAVQRASSYMKSYANGWVWRTDIAKFFDSVDQKTLFGLITRRISCKDTLWLTHEVLYSYYKNKPGRGMPIGNLTSQIFANVYFNEFDRFMVHTLKPRAYLRYGDDWLCFADDQEKLAAIRNTAVRFLSEVLGLSISQKLDIMTPVSKGVTYLGIDMWPNGQRITKATRVRMHNKLEPSNYSSYEAFVRQFSTEKTIKRFYWQTIDI